MKQNSVIGHAHVPLSAVCMHKVEAEVHKQTLSGSHTCVYEDSISLMALLCGFLSHYSD